MVLKVFLVSEVLKVFREIKDLKDLKESQEFKENEDLRESLALLDPEVNKASQVHKVKMGSTLIL